MSTSRALIKTVSSVSLVFGLDWFAILGSTVNREVRRIARQHNATHAVHASEDTASVGITTLPPGKRGVVLYSAAQLVAQRFTTGAVAIVVQLDDTRWWFVAVHEGAVIARTDHIYTTHAEISALIGQLRQAYPALSVLDEEHGSPSVSDLAANLTVDAELRRVAYGSRILSRPSAWVALGLMLALVLYKILFDTDSRRRSLAAHDVVPEVAWNTALRSAIDGRWVHGTAGTRDVLQSLYEQPVEVAGWRLLHIDCALRVSQWDCHSDYTRHGAEASNERFLVASLPEWAVSFTPLDKARVQWSLPSTGLGLAHTDLQTGRANERELFSRLQAIRSALALVSIDASKPLPVPAPVDQNGQTLPRPPGLPQFRTRAVRIQAPLRSLALLLPYCDAMTWHRVVISLSPHIKPDLIHSRLNVTLQGLIYEKD